MGGCPPKGHITDLRNMRTEDKSEDREARAQKGL